MSKPQKQNLGICFKFRALIESPFWGLHIFDFNLRKQKKGECKTT